MIKQLDLREEHFDRSIRSSRATQYWCNVGICGVINVPAGNFKGYMTSGRLRSRSPKNASTSSKAASLSSM